MPKCKICGSTKTSRAGGQMTTEGRKQRYQCKECGHVWVSDQPYFKI